MNTKIKLLQDTFGECKICGLECRLRCERCPWIFYCSTEHQTIDWPAHQLICTNIVWGEDGVARAGRDLAAGTEILEKSTIFVAPRFYTDIEAGGITDDNFDEIIHGKLRPCFGCYEVIPPYLNMQLICGTCKFPIHGNACEASAWHEAECKILKTMNIVDWYEDLGKRDFVMIHLAVLRGILLKQAQPSIWAEIIALGANSIYMTSQDLKNSTIYFITVLCQISWITVEEIVKFLSIYMKFRLNCCLATGPTKKYVVQIPSTSIFMKIYEFYFYFRMVSVICSGMIPFTLVRDDNANIQGGVYNYRMRMNFRTIKNVFKGEILTIGRGGS